MSKSATRLFFSALLLQAILTALMPPGLCSCWLNPAVKEFHVHFGRPSPGHSHEYLSSMADSTVADTTTKINSAIDLLILATLAGGMTFLVKGQLPRFKSWSPAPPLPPPRMRITGRAAHL